MSSEKLKKIANFFWIGSIVQTIMLSIFVSVGMMMAFAGYFFEIEAEAKKGVKK